MDTYVSGPGILDDSSNPSRPTLLSVLKVQARHTVTFDSQKLLRLFQ
jgi:hypothetical protein